MEPSLGCAHQTGPLAEWTRSCGSYTQAILLSYKKMHSSQLQQVLFDLNLRRALETLSGDDLRPPGTLPESPRWLLSQRETLRAINIMDHIAQRTGSCLLLT